MLASMVRKVSSCRSRTSVFGRLRLTLVSFSGLPGTRCDSTAYGRCRWDCARPRAHSSPANQQSGALCGRASNSRATAPSQCSTSPPRPETAQATGRRLATSSNCSRLPQPNRARARHPPPTQGAPLLAACCALPHFGASAAMARRCRALPQARQRCSLNPIRK